MLISKLVRQALASLMVVAVASGQQASSPFALADGAPIRLRLNRNLSSADARVGETVDFEVLEDIVVNGTTIAPRGGVALATVTDAQPKGRMGRAGRLNVAIDHLRLVSGEKVPLRAIKEAKGGGNTGKMTGAIVATSIVFFPAAPLFLFMKGKDITIPRGTEITAYVNGEIRLDPVRFGAAPQGRPASVQANQMPASTGVVAPGAMTNDDVVALRRAGFDDAVIIAKVRKSQGAFRLDTPDLVGLKNAGVSQAVIAAMLEQGGGGN
jgi:hypothetical protein